MNSNRLVVCFREPVYQIDSFPAKAVVNSSCRQLPDFRVTFVLACLKDTFFLHGMTSSCKNSCLDYGNLMQVP